MIGARPPSADGNSDVSRKTIWIPKGASAEAVQVKVGLSDGSYTELLDDKLKEGDKVVTDASVNGQATNTKTTTTQSPPGGAMRRMF